jgi:hypothetical protein
MQVLITTGTTAGTTPIYLPFNVAPLPFGDPWSNVTLTLATPSVITVAGFTPVQSGLVSFSVGGGAVLGTLTSLTVSANQVYYITSISGQTFSVSTISSGTPLNAFTTGLQAGTASLITMHTLSGEVDGPVCPFETGATVLAMNAGVSATIGSYTSTFSFAPITLFGAADKASTTTTAAYGTVLGPSTYSVIATVAFGAPKLITLSNDWIVASGSTSTLVLLQN